MQVFDKDAMMKTLLVAFVVVGSATLMSSCMVTTPGSYYNTPGYVSTGYYGGHGWHNNYWQGTRGGYYNRGWYGGHGGYGRGWGGRR